MTGPGTNSYLVGIDEVAVIDPGPADDGHLDAIAGCGGDRIRWILCTHTHADHSPGAAGLKERTGATVLAFDSRDGLVVDDSIGEGFRIEATEFRLTAIHTPGHASNHLCYLLEQERMVFSGDHVMQGSTVVIRPPDGDMADYLDSLERLRSMRLRSIAPGHGHLIEDPRQALADYVAHRLEREQQIVDVIETGSVTVPEIVERVYVGLDEELVEQAGHSVTAHLLKLKAEGRAAVRQDRWRSPRPARRAP
jgi:glyoxylase-like metal-dependent hydrolase (beta-lactamase superfamily II)